MKKQISFICPLANVDSTILKLKLSHGFKIESLSANDGLNHFSKLLSLPPKVTGRRLAIESPCLNYEEQKIYYLTKKIEVNEIKKINPFTKELVDFENKIFRGYLSTILSLLRLFKEGNIYTPFHMYYYEEKGKINRIMELSSSKPIEWIKYSLNDEELPILYKFLEEMKLPLKHDYIQLAFENFELSYHSNIRELSYLSLMISLETMFQPSEFGELRYRISRNVAVLLGGIIGKDSIIIQNEIKKLYGKRSAIVHSGKKDVIDNQDLLLLRHYVRESIKQAILIDKSKDGFLGSLNSRGFDSN